MQALSSSAKSIETSKQTFSTISNSVRPLYDIMQSNFGPSGNFKMLISGGGDIKISKDGSTILNEMQIKNPITAIIAKTVSMQERMAGDGTTALIMLIASLIIEAEKYVMENIHINHLIEGISIGMEYCQEILKKMAIKTQLDRPTLVDIARSSVATKVNSEIANIISEQCVDAIHHIFDRNTMQINLHMIEIMSMTHKTANDTQLVRGIVMDHGGRHPNMPRELRNCHILVANVSLEYEKTEVNANVAYSSASQREAMFKSEREYIDKRCRQIVDLKNQVCKDDGKSSFVVLTMGGIDTHSLDILARNQILALRRIKKRNLERLTLCCGGTSVNSTENLRSSHLGFAGHVQQLAIGEENYTIVDQCQNPRSVTLLIKGPNTYTIDQVKDAIQDGLMATTNALVEQVTLPGACAFELEAARSLLKMAQNNAISARLQLGIDVLAKSFENLAKSLVINAGFDGYDLILENKQIEITEKNNANDLKSSKKYYGINVENGKLFLPAERGIYDSYNAKIMMLHAASSVVKTFMSVDAIIKSAPEGMRGKQ